MDDCVRDCLCRLIADHGRSLCTTPRVLAMMLRQHCPDGGSPIQDLERALSSGGVAPLLAGPVEAADGPDMVHTLCERTGLSEGRALWAVECFVLALNGTANGPPLAKDWTSWNRLDVSAATAGGGMYVRSVWHLGIVGLAGALGGTLLGLVLLMSGEADLIEPWRLALDGLPEWARPVCLLALGGLGGVAGGLLGWIFGGGRIWTYDAFGGTTLGRLVIAAIGALHGGAIGVMAGLGLLGLIGAAVGALAGAFLGAFLGLLSAERLSRYWWA